MKSFGLKALTAISAIAILSGALTGCAATAKPEQGVTDCQDLSNPQSWSNRWSYQMSTWKHGSKMYPAFGLYKCSESATITMRFTTVGLNFVTGTSYVSYGDKQITIANSPTPGTKWFNSESVVEVPSGITKVAPGVTFQPIVEITQSHFGFASGKEPIRAIITLKSKGKKAITFEHTLQFEVGSWNRFSGSNENEVS